MTRTLLADWEMLDEMRLHPSHVHTLTVANGQATIRCLDCILTFEGELAEAVSAWNAHLESA